MNDKDPCWPCDQEVIEKLPPCPLQCRSEKCKAFKKATFEGKPIIWLLGVTGSGKSTQCGKIVSKYGFMPLYYDTLLQEEVKSGSVRGKCLSKVMQRKEEAPNDVIVDLLKTAIYKNVQHAKGFVLDGFPKVKTQAVMFEKRIRPSTVIIYLEATSDTLAKRLASKTPATTEQTVKQKLKTIMENDELLLAAYSEKAYRINAEVDVESMFREITEILDPLVTLHKAP